MYVVIVHLRVQYVRIYYYTTVRTTSLGDVQSEPEIFGFWRLRMVGARKTRSSLVKRPFSFFDVRTVSTIY